MPVEVDPLADISTERFELLDRLYGIELAEPLPFARAGDSQADKRAVRQIGVVPQIGEQAGASDACRVESSAELPVDLVPGEASTQRPA